MMLISSGKPAIAFYVPIGLLSLLLFVECGKVRLVGPSRCSGRVEVYFRDSWGTVCHDDWSLANADVVCQELNCGTAVEAKKGAFFGEGKEAIWLDDVNCVGQESSILDCLHRPLGENNCGHNEDAGVICAEHVRLVNGTNRCSGRVEVYHNGLWKRLCNTDFRKEEAEVVCREINCGLPSSSLVPTFGLGHDVNTLKSVCVGNESSISNCTLQDFRDTCVDAAAVCTNSKPIRLMNGTNSCSGRVELYHDGQWGTICDDRWGMEEATVTCREMNCGNALAVKYKAFFGRGDDQVWLDDVECIGNEMSLSDCRHKGFGKHDCDHNEDAGVICSETTRLINGTDSCSGKVELFHNGAWRKICNNNWGDKEASVVCAELSCGAPKKYQETFGYDDISLVGYTSRCSGNVSSISQCTIEEHTGRCEGVSLSCEGSPVLRLVNGTDECSGRVEILHDGQWGTVCDDDWDIRDAQVVCRAMDCGSAQTAKSSAFFGQGAGNIWLDDINCVGNESSLLHCQRPAFGENNCGHGEDAGVICTASIRLINGSDQCSGRVEFNHGGQWHPAYNVNWGMNEATVVCREMNCGDPVQASGSFGQRGDLRGYRISCTGRENALTECTLTDYVRQGDIEEASVQCSGNVKLVGGGHHCAGRVEYYNKGQWGTICGESWDFNDAGVVCRQFDCGKANKITTMDASDQGKKKTWIDRIECGGSESTLSQCPQRQYEDRTCNTTSIAGVECTGSLAVRLGGGSDECSGRVEVRHGEEWQTVCDTDWNMSKAEVICDILECGRAMTAPGSAHFGQGKGSVVEASNSCFGNATFVQQCSLNGFKASTCGHEHDAGVVCAAQIRLVGGSGECSGRVEIFHKNEWGTVCDDSWKMSNADVVCRQLGCGHAVSAPHSAHFGRGGGPIWLDNVDCTGQEYALSHCNHPGFGENNCGHSEDASAICSGALSKPQITISPSPEVNWGDRVEIICTVATEQLGGTFILKTTQGSFERKRFSEHEFATFVFHNVDFNQKGSYFCEYQKKLPNEVINFPQGPTAELSVTVKLDTPSISLTSPHAMVIYSPDKLSVNKGSSFSVTCSTHSKYPKGFFYLTKSNTNTSASVPAISHSIFHLAHFEFASVDYEHQGEYSCVFSVNISSKSFCSPPSKSLEVTVVSTSSSSTVTGVVVMLVLVLVMLVIGFLLWRRRWRGADVMVQFSNRFGGALKHDTDERNNRTFDGRDLYTQVYGDKDEEENVDSDHNEETVAEDVAGRVSSDLEPLFLS